MNDAYVFTSSTEHYTRTSRGEINKLFQKPEKKSNSVSFVIRCLDVKTLTSAGISKGREILVISGGLYSFHLIMFYDTYGVMYSNYKEL
jgi:hypothetical protein